MDPYSQRGFECVLQAYGTSKPTMYLSSFASMLFNPTVDSINALFYFLLNCRTATSHLRAGVAGNVKTVQAESSGVAEVKHSRKLCQRSQNLLLEA